MRDHPPIHVTGPALVAMLTLTKHQLIDMLIEVAPAECRADPVILIAAIQKLANEVMPQRIERVPNLVRVFEEEAGRRERRCLGVEAQSAAGGGYDRFEEATILRMFCEPIQEPDDAG
jgi:hypothetical protein